MKRFEVSLCGENGGTTAVAMMMLVLLTCLALGSSMIAMIEARMAAGDRFFSQGLYLAESAAMEGIRRIEAAAEDTLKSGLFAWVTDQTGVIDRMDAPGWGGSASAPSLLDGRARYGALYRGVAPGSSLGMGESRLHSYSVFGRFEDRRGRCLVEIGYRKRF